jgi:chloramphenicol-sensitive protein RarD
VETALMAPLAVVYLGWIAADPARGAFAHDGVRVHALLAGTGLVTALPLLWFTAAARRLPLSTIGFLQYLAPTGQFLTAVLVFGEPLAARKLVAFGFIWAALVVFSVDLRLAALRAGAGTGTGIPSRSTVPE